MGFRQHGLELGLVGGNMFKNFELVHALMEGGLSITTAESCTGGMIASAIVDVPDASKVFSEAFITYADDVKSKTLAVNKLTIKQNGVVSEEVAKEMATGAARKTGAEIAVSTTGYAGPSGGDESKPVGTVCFGFYISGYVTTKTRFFTGTRNQIRTQATEYAIETLVKMIS